MWGTDAIRLEVKLDLGALPHGSPAPWQLLTDLAKQVPKPQTLSINRGINPKLLGIKIWCVRAHTYTHTLTLSHTLSLTRTLSLTHSLSQRSKMQRVP